MKVKLTNVFIIILLFDSGRMHWKNQTQDQFLELVGLAMEHNWLVLVQMVKLYLQASFKSKSIYSNGWPRKLLIICASSILTLLPLLPPNIILADHELFYQTKTMLWKDIISHNYFSAPDSKKSFILR